jgi:hypothetical protein
MRLCRQGALGDILYSSCQALFDTQHYQQFESPAISHFTPLPSRCSVLVSLAASLSLMATCIRAVHHPLSRLHDSREDLMSVPREVSRGSTSLQNSQNSGDTTPILGNRAH